MGVHILGICGTFMGGLAMLCRELGVPVSGSDQGIYPPMSDQLRTLGIALVEGFDDAQLDADHDQVLVGNALSRGNPCIERLLDEKRPLVSGPAWLAERVLRGRTVLAVAGTHGKTSTASMLAWILDAGGRQPGFLIGGVPGNFGVSARLGGGELFVVEADEYDTAFFDKRSKFVHYRPDVLVVNNLEFDHADIFRDLDDVRRQFHHLVRLVPRRGTVIAAHADPQVQALLAMGCYSRLQRFGEAREADWSLRLHCEDARRFSVQRRGGGSWDVHWEQIGRHNAHNALAAVAAAHAVGLDPEAACAALSDFVPARRRLELIASVRGIRIYDDFAHHPTAIRSTLQGLRAFVGDAPIVAVLDPASNTMRMGVHRHTLGPALALADRVVLHDPGTGCPQLDEVASEIRGPAQVCKDVDAIIEVLSRQLRAGDHVLIMSNGGFGGLQRRLAQALEQH